MNFQQPNNITTDQETQDQIIAMRVLISDREAEINKLDSIITSNRYTIQQLSNQKADLEDFVKNAAKTSDLLTKEVDGLNAQCGEAKTELENTRKESAALKQEMINRLADVVSREKVMEEAINDLRIHQEALVENSRTLELGRLELNAKLEQLKSIIL